MRPGRLHSPTGTPQNAGMDRALVIDTLRRHAPELRQRFGVCRLSLFGSAARDELREDSDIDVLVDFQPEPTMLAYFGAQDLLQQALGRPVDLVTVSGLKARARALVERDRIDVA
jgi:predicted nucleotidyltransferase